MLVFAYGVLAGTVGLYTYLRLARVIPPPVALAAARVPAVEPVLPVPRFGDDDLHRLAAGAAVVATAGSTIPLLRNISALAWRSDHGPQDVPVNRTAAAAGIPKDPQWTLNVAGQAFCHQCADDLYALIAIEWFVHL